MVSANFRRSSARLLVAGLGILPMLFSSASVAQPASPGPSSSNVISFKEHVVDIKAARHTFETYLKAWSALDDAQRQRILGETISAEINYFDTLARLKGRDDLAAHLAGFQSRRPGYSFSLGNFLLHHDMALANWIMHDETGKILVRGYDSVHFDAVGHVDSIIGFSDVAAQKGD